MEDHASRALFGAGQEASLIVAGWCMKQNKPRDFILSRQPLLPLNSDAALTLTAMIETAETFGLVLRGALKSSVGEGSALEQLRETFFIDTQAAFEAGVTALLRGEPPVDVASAWVRAMEQVALRIFEQEALLGLDQERPKDMKKIVQEHGDLRAVFAGWRKPGGEAYAKLGLPPREKKSREAA